MLRFPKRRTPWLTAWCLFFNTLLEVVSQPRITPDGKAQTDSKAQQPLQYVSISRGLQHRHRASGGVMEPLLLEFQEKFVSADIHLFDNLQQHLLVPFDGATDTDRAVLPADRVLEPEVPEASRVNSCRGALNGDFLHQSFPTSMSVSISR
jgi:hypothetical protein